MSTHITPSPLGTFLLFVSIFAIGWGLEIHGRYKDDDEPGIDPDELQRSIDTHPSNGGRW